MHRFFLFAAVALAVNVACVPAAGVLEIAVQCDTSFDPCGANAADNRSVGSQSGVRQDRPPKSDDFSELTLFLFGSGLALFVALLGWSDEIRGINQDTRELEERFLATTKIQKKDFLAVVKPLTPDDQLVALAQILASAKPQTVEHVKVLEIFNRWHTEWTKLEVLSAWKYRLALSLTFAMFIAGLASLFVNPQTVLGMCGFQVRAVFLILVLPMAGIVAILFLIAAANRKAMYFEKLLNSLAEKV